MIAAREAFVVPNDYDELFKTAGRQYGVDWLLLKAIAWQESTFRPAIMGDGGDAYGLFQINTRWLNIENLGFNKTVNLLDPVISTNVAAALIADNAKILRRRGIEPTTLRLAGAYNGGVGKIDADGRISGKVDIYAFTVAGRRDFLALIG